MSGAASAHSTPKLPPANGRRESPSARRAESEYGAERRWTAASQEKTEAMMVGSRNDALPRKPRGVKRVRGRNGKTYYYLATASGMVRLNGMPGTAEFQQSLVEAQRKSPQTPRADLFESLIRDFLASPEHRKTSANTQRLRRVAFKLIGARFGSLAIKDFNRRQIRRDIYNFRNDLMETPSMADACLKALSRLLTWAYDHGFDIEVNHAQRVDRFCSADSRANIIWTDSEREKFIAEAAPHMARAFDMLFYSAARVGDAQEWRWSQYDGRWLTYQPMKTARSTGVEVHLPVYALPPFQRLLDSMERKGKHILLTETGRPWTKTYLSKRLYIERRRIFGPDLDRHTHDLRGTVTTKLIDAGCTDREVSAITGHVSTQVSTDRAQSLSAYVKRTRQQAINAYSKWYAAEFAPKGEVVAFPTRA
jgi:integrase